MLQNVMIRGNNWLSGEEQEEEDGRVYVALSITFIPNLLDLIAFNKPLLKLPLPLYLPRST